MSVNWDDLQLIDGISFRDGANGKVATARYRLLASLLSSAPERGDSATSMHARTDGWYIDDVDLQARDAYTYMVSVTAVPFIAVNMSYEKSEIRSLPPKISYEQRDFVFTAEMLGVKKLPENPADVRELNGTTAVDYTDSSPLPGYSPVDYDSTGEYLKDFSLAKSVTPNASPFTKRPNWPLIGQTVKTDVVAITFYVRANFGSRYMDFTGVSGSLSIPTQYRIPDSGTTGMWRCLDQTRNERRDNQGRDFFEITRRLQRAPKAADAATGADLRWDPAKNGGTMQWLRS